MTEDEAKKKWCPDSRLTPVISSVNNSWYDGTRNITVTNITEILTALNINRPEGHTLCIGNGCMSWRWGEMIGGEWHGFCGKHGRPGAEGPEQPVPTKSTGS